MFSLLSLYSCGPAWESHGFPIENVGNDSVGLKMSGRTGGLKMSGMTAGDSLAGEGRGEGLSWHDREVGEELNHMAGNVRECCPGHDREVGEDPM